jgi:Flp pilus assembly protein TadD
LNGTASPSLPPLPDFFRNTRLQGLLLFGFACLLYANTLTHGFVLDDGIVITDNMYTQQGVKGIPGILSKDTFFGFFKVEGKETLVSGGRYRPMTLVLFAIVYQFVGANPFVFHLLTVLLFGATCVLFYRVLLRLLAPRGSDYAAAFAWLAALLFAAHPIHTEVVANIKGCDEIVALLGSIAALYCTLRAFDGGQAKWAIGAGLAFFAACLSKENAAAFVLIVPLALWVFRRADAGALIRHSTPVWVAFVLFFLLRGSILHWKFGGAPMELMNNPYLKLNAAQTQWVSFAPAEKLATIFYTLWKYVQLLVVPHPLTHDYYPRQIGIMRFSHPMVLFSLALYLGMAWYALSGIGKHRDPLRFGILAYLLPLGIVSNFVFPIGTNMGERFAFMPSAGFCMAAAALLLYFAQKRGQWTPVVATAVVVAALFGLKTALRNPAWASNETLFFADAETSANSAKLQNACGSLLFEKAGKETNEVKRQELCTMAMPYLDRALSIYPNYSDAYVSRGGAHYYLRNYDQSIADYRKAVALAPGEPRWKTYLALALRDAGKMYGERMGDVARAYGAITESWQLNPTDAETARLLGVANGVQGKHAEAINWFTKATQLNPAEASYLFDLGMAYSASGDLAKGEALRQQAVQKDPKLLSRMGGK